jgi:hypothetical protein
LADADYDPQSHCFYVTCGVCGAVITGLRSIAETHNIQKTHDEECTT